jgi:serine/threonine protein kinase/Flp pilus assembly protein TadD
MSEASVREEVSLESLVAEVADDFLERQRRGERPDVEEYAARYPHAAEVLRKVVASLQLVGLSAEGGPVPGNAAEGEPVAGTLGDFRIVREVGRGGMGVVYEAEQVSLRRRVALKVLPYAGMLDPRHLQRFHNEARAAASLEHPHIVPVYGVGSERSVHYYAMKFIDGQSLDALLHDLRRPAAATLPQPPPSPTDPTIDEGAAGGPAAAKVEGRAESILSVPLDTGHFRRVAQWGGQAAEALEHAHSLGVVHRDIKPGNLMLDGQGKLWVTDFGLAHVQHGEASLTMTGDLVGTLRYMSPEQALAKHGLVDHRTDVYSLAATLYELLTLRPVFGGNDREELLRQIAFEEPAPPRRLNKAVPAELEVVVLKALDKSPADRYATAQELADDLRRWLDDRPIRARRPSLVDRARKWARRHKAVIGAAVVTLLLAVVLLAASTVVIWRAKEETERALSERTQALQRAQEQEQEAKRNALEAGRQRARADDNFRQAIEEISQLVKATEDDPSTGRTPSPEEVRKAQADRSFAFYQRLLRENRRTDPAGRLQTGLVYRGLLPLYSTHGDAAKAVDAYGQAVALFKQLAVESPAEARYLEELRKTHISIQQSIRVLHNIKTNRELARGRYKEAAKTWQQVVTMSEALITEQPDEPNWFILGVAFTWLGRELWAAGQATEAEAALSKALPIFEKFTGDPREADKSAWREEALAYESRGKLRAETGRFPEAEADFRQALALLETMATDEFWLELQRYPFASTQEALGNVLWATGRHEEATAAFRRADEARQQLLRSRGSTDFSLVNAMARFYATCPDKQFRNPAKAVEFAKEAVEKVGKSDHHPRDEGDCWKTLGVAQYRAGDWKAAVAALDKAMPFRSGGDGTDWFVLAMVHQRLGDKEEARRWYDKAVEWMGKNKPQDEELRSFRAEAAELLKIDGNPKDKPDKGRGEKGGR